MSTLYALFIGINAYPTGELHGCINDVLAVRGYFQRLCAAQKENGQPCIETNFQYLLAPLGKEEKEKLRRHSLEPGDEDKLFKDKGRYYKPIRQNIIQAFKTHFSQADPQKGDFCLLYYSGHGSMMPAPDVFSEVEPTGAFQTLVLLDSREPGQRDLIDKELGYLIAEMMQDKGPGGNRPGVHFLTIMDCCHSGTNTRDDDPGVTVRQLKEGPAVGEAGDILGFAPDGNVFYEKLVEIDGQRKIRRGGIRHGRHISLAAARDAEKALEQSIQLGAKAEEPYGVFTYCLLQVLEQAGAHLSYGELIRRVQMAVRGRTSRQIPVLGNTIPEEEDLLFFDNQLKTPKPEYNVAFRRGRWYLDAGAIHGIVPSRGNNKALVRIWRESPEPKEKLVEIEEVLPAESILDGKAFGEGEEQYMYKAIVAAMPFPRIRVGFDNELSKEMKKQIEAAYEKHRPHYVQLVKEGGAAGFLIRQATDGRQNKYLLTLLNGSIPLFVQAKTAAELLFNANKVGKWEGIKNMDNPEAAAAARQHRHNIQIAARKLEGYDFDEPTFNSIPDAAFSEPLIGPLSLSLSYRKTEQGKMQQPAMRVKVANLSEERAYWVGALYLNSQFGISHRYLEVQKLDEEEGNTWAELKFRHGEATFEGIPLSIDEAFLHQGITEITDYLIFYISDKEFSLSPYFQEVIPLEAPKEGDARGYEFKEEEKVIEKDFWFTIKIPVHIRYAGGS
ncbi:MAG: caspase family protein [Lewinellaceae bacterium]|nr:caspase family protein [Lewinellaceae bacterium]